MFIDEMFEDYLVNKGKNLAETIADICADKLANKEDWNFTTIRRIENGYQLFRKRHPEYPEQSFRTYTKIASPKLAEAIGWN